MQVTNRMVWGLAGLLVAGIAGHQWRLHAARPAAGPEDTWGSESAPAVISSPMPGSREEWVPEHTPFSEAPRASSPGPDPAPVANALDNPVVKDMMLQRQVCRMKDYAAQAGPGDPFSMTSEEIEEFRKHGDPVVW